jgi:hypothetical protein
LVCFGLGLSIFSVPPPPPFFFKSFDTVSLFHFSVKSATYWISIFWRDTPYLFTPFYSLSIAHNIYSNWFYLKTKNRVRINQCCGAGAGAETARRSRIISLAGA